ncbi:MAG: Uma2 family endonuclease [Tepidisphaeraceae bacterium]
MASTLLNHLFQDPSPLVPLSVDQYHQMIRTGVLREGAHIELLDGFLVYKDRSQAGKDPMTVGHQHAVTVMKLERLLRSAEEFGCHVRVQQPITLPPDDEPEPDLALVRGAVDDYADSHPRAEDILCVIEVADSSLRFDRTTKQAIYARGGIRQYVIVNLAGKEVENHLVPDPAAATFTEHTNPGRGDSLQIQTPAQTLTIPIAAFLPA